MKFKLRKLNIPKWKKKTKSNPKSSEPKEMKSVIRQKVEYGLFAAAVMLLVAGLLYFSPNVITVSNTVGDKELPISCVSTNENKVALTFDAAWGNEDTQTLLELLEKHDVKATFFVTGAWIEKYSDAVKAIAAAGHDIGNHGETSTNMSQLSRKEIETELKTVHEKIKGLTGVEMELFRPPFGDYNNDVVITAKACGYYTIQWDVDSLDWKDYGVESIINSILDNKHLGKGSIILLRNGAKYTPEALETVILGLKEKGYELVPVSELLIRGGYHLDQEGRQVPNN